MLLAKRVVQHDSQHERGSGVWPPPNSKENPDSQKSSLIKLLILKKCSFASSFVSLLMGTYPAAAARRNKLINGNEAMGQWAATWRG